MLTAIQLIFGLMNGKLFKASHQVTYNDLNFGVPAFMTCIEAVIFSLIFHWAYSPGEYKEGQRMDRYGVAPVKRTKTWRAILDALNLADLIAGTLVAMKYLPVAISQSKFLKGRGGGSNQRMTQGQMGMEPLSHGNNRMRGYSGGSEFDDTSYSPPMESSEYGGAGMHPPAMPRSAREPSPAGRARTWRADQLRPQMVGGTEYEPLTRSRDPSPNGLPPQHPQHMV
jgi:hypothetical protein